MEKKCNNAPFLLLMQTSKAIHDRIKKEMATYNLGITEFSVLEVLYQKGKQTIQQIGNKILISSGSMTYVIDKLEKRNLLSRVACPNDRRAIHIILTEDGQKMMEEIMPKYHVLVEDMFQSLNEEDTDTFVQFLKNIKESI